MSNALDLGLYFARIGYRGPRVAALDVLRVLRVLRRHPQAIPLDNLDRTGRPPGRDQLAERLGVETGGLDLPVLVARVKGQTFGV